MTTTVAPVSTPAPATATRTTATADLLRSEWTKIRSLRSTVWSLLLLAVVTLGFTALFTALAIAQWATMDPVQKQQLISDPGRIVLGAGFQLGQLAVCVLGVLVIAGEYSSGTIRASLLAVPRRTPMLAAKAAVFAIARGALVRHTAGAITGIIGFVLVLSPLAQLLPGSVGKHIHAYLPSEAGSLIASPHQGVDDLLGPWQGLGVFCLETAVLIAAAAYLLKRRDA